MRCWELEEEDQWCPTVREDNGCHTFYLLLVEAGVGVTPRNQLAEGSSDTMIVSEFQFRLTTCNMTFHATHRQ